MNSEQYALALQRMVEGEGENLAVADGEGPETRSSLAAPDAFLEQFFDGMGTTTAGVMVNEQTALTSASVYQAVRILSEAVASLPFLIYRRLPGGGRDKNLAHPLFAILDQAPNEEMSAFTFRETMMGYALLWGNGFAEIERNNAGEPIALNPIRPDRVKPIRDPNTRQLKYKVLQTNKPEAIVDKADMFHLKGLGFDGLVGYSVVKMARQSMAVGMAAEASSAAFFGNGVKTQGYLKHPGELSEKAWNNLRNSFAEKYGGPYNSSKPMLLEQGVEYVPIMMSFQDAQFLQSREFQVEEIARWFNLPPHKLGKMERATNSNIEQQSIDFVVHSVRPWLIRMEAEVLLKLFSLEERATLYAEHNVDALLRGDIKSRYDAYSIAVNTGFMLIDEAREIENRNPLPGGVGSTALVSVNAQPLAVVAKVAEMAAEGILPAALGGSGTAGDPSGNANKNKGVGAGGDEEKKPAGEKPVEIPDEGHSAVRSMEIFSPLIVSAADRAVRREIEGLTRAARKPDFVGYLPKFYGEQEAYFRTQLEPVIEAMAKGMNGDGARMRAVGAELAGRYVEQSIGELRSAIEAVRLNQFGDIDTAEIAAVIDPVLERWKRERAIEVAGAFK